MKKIFILLFFIFLVNAFYAEKTIDLYRVYLKNKSIYIGKVIEIVPDVKIVIQTLDKNILHFQWDDIEKFEFIENEKTKMQIGSPLYYKKFQTLRFLMGYSITVEENQSMTNIFSLEIPISKSESGYFFVQCGFMEKESYDAGSASIGLKLFNVKKPYSIYFSASIGPVYYDGYGHKSYYWYGYHTCEYPSDRYEIVKELNSLFEIQIGIHSTNKFCGCTQFYIGFRAISYDYYDYRWVCDDEYCTSEHYEKEINSDSYIDLVFGINFGF
ncbi:hypothetical protein KAU32_06150 [bacterium]|nr:hypothetical protein [bacterium]